VISLHISRRDVHTYKVPSKYTRKFLQVLEWFMQNHRAWPVLLSCHLLLNSNDIRFHKLDSNGKRCSKKAKAGRCEVLISCLISWGAMTQKLYMFLNCSNYPYLFSSSKHISNRIDSMTFPLEVTNKIKSILVIRQMAQVQFVWNPYHYAYFLTGKKRACTYN
jgi:hypothetical protein